MLGDTFPGADCLGLRLYYAEGLNELTWTALGEPILVPSLSGWDNRDIYRSSFVTGGGQLRIWYSASNATYCDSYGPPWHVGYTQGALPDLTAARTGACGQSPSYADPALVNREGCRLHGRQSSLEQAPQRVITTR